MRPIRQGTYGIGLRFVITDHGMPVPLHERTVRVVISRGTGHDPIVDRLAEVEDPDGGVAILWLEDGDTDQTGSFQIELIVEQEGERVVLGTDVRLPIERRLSPP